MLLDDLPLGRIVQIKIWDEYIPGSGAWVEMILEGVVVEKTFKDSNMRDVTKRYVQLGNGKFIEII